MHDLLRGAVIAPHGYGKTAAGGVDTLVMVAVDGEGCAIERTAGGSLRCHRPMGKILAVNSGGMGGRCGKILVERAAEIYIQQLQTSANAENRLACIQKSLGQSHFRFVTLLVDIHRAVNRLPIEPGMEIAAAAENKGIKAFFKLGAVAGGYLGTGPGEGLHIGAGVVAAGGK